jgi:hypothetical protein
VALSDRALNRALLARQGLLTPFDAEYSLAAVVESIGAVQAQHWPAVAESLATRVRGFDPGRLYRALAAGDLVVGTSIRRTLHLVSAREHGTYAAVAGASGVDDWWRAGGPPPGGGSALRADLLAFAERTRTADELAAFVEQRVGDRLDPAELAAQRQYRWRPFYTWSRLVRVPPDGTWSARTPAAYRAAPGEPVDADVALEAAVRCHLRAFGPAAADDVATWLGTKTPPVRRALARLGPESFPDAAGRTLYDLPAAPRPDAGVPAPVRLLPSFDSTLLAYAHRHRRRILPDEHRDRVYARANLRIRPSLLVDGFVAGTWSVAATRRAATLTVTPFRALDEATRADIEAEGCRLLAAVGPSTSDHRVVIDVP